MLFGLDAKEIQADHLHASIPKSIIRDSYVGLSQLVGNIDSELI